MNPPKAILKKFEGIFSRFLWDSRDDAPRLLWKRWKDLCILTVEGGLGFRRLQDLVDTFSLKLWWLFRSQRSLWAHFLLSKYCKGTHPLLNTIPYYASTVWKRLKHIGQQAKTHIAWQLGHWQIFFWHDCWMGESTLADEHPHLTHSSIQVRELFDDTGWNISRLLQLVPHIIAKQMGNIPITADVHDQIMWKDTSDGRFHTKSAWQLVCTEHTIQAVYVDVVIQMRIGSHMASRCQCCSAIEAIQHLFIDSCIANQVWRHFFDIFHVTLRPMEGFQYRFQFWRFSGQFFRQGHIRMIVPLLILWFIWTTRNDAKYQDISMEPKQIIWKVCHNISLLHTGHLFRVIHWRGYMDITPLFGISLTTPSMPPSVSFIGVLHQGDLTRSTLMDASKMDLRVEEGLLEIHHDSVFAPSSLHMENDMDHPMSQLELFNHVHRTNHELGNFIDNKFKRVHDKYKASIEFKYDTISDNQPKFDPNSWINVVNRPSKVCINGFGPRQLVSHVLGTSTSLKSSILAHDFMSM
ncbi:Uncharacterized protein Adt_40095 [Abeliophyllum distichum]|uniref:Uncharacterized protein n=1 Tax=Abeliophyllum distichum TaxID=126358 RepID=A0ABD1Q7X1_9LAMI